MADDNTRLSPHMDIRKKRSVQFLVDCHLHDGECSGAGNFAEGSGYSSSHEGDNLSIRSAGSANRALTACPIRSASPRPSSSTGYPDSGDEGEDGSPISISRPANAPEDLAVFDIGLGMIRQHTIYRVQFLIPAAGRLDTEDVELVRSNVAVPEEGKQFKISANIDVIKIEYMKDDSLYKLTLKMTTTSSSHIFESFALRESGNNDRCVYFILLANALGKGHGTPSLRLGIHQLGHTDEYEDSEGKTEWAGFEDDEDSKEWP